MPILGHNLFKDLFINLVLLMPLDSFISTSVDSNHVYFLAQTHIFFFFFIWRDLSNSFSWPESHPFVRTLVEIWVGCYLSSEHIVYQVLSRKLYQFTLVFFHEYRFHDSEFPEPGYHLHDIKLFIQPLLRLFKHCFSLMIQFSVFLRIAAETESREVEFYQIFIPVYKHFSMREDLVHFW